MRFYDVVKRVDAMLKRQKQKKKKKKALCKTKGEEGKKKEVKRK